MRLSGLVFLVLLAGCSNPSIGPKAPLDLQFVLAPGESADVQDAGIRLRFEGVSGDSRCPGDATCIQAGDALVRVSVLSSGTVATHDLHTGNMQPLHQGELTIALVQLTPYPFVSRPIAANDYRATLRVTR